MLLTGTRTTWRLICWRISFYAFKSRWLYKGLWRRRERKREPQLSSIWLFMLWRSSKIYGNCIGPTINFVQCRESIFKIETDQDEVEIYHGTRKTSKPYVDICWIRHPKKMSQHRTACKRICRYGPWENRLSLSFGMKLWIYKCYIFRTNRFTFGSKQYQICWLSFFMKFFRTVARIEFQCTFDIQMAFAIKFWKDYCTTDAAHWCIKVQIF